MQGSDSVGLAISFTAGVLSFLSPCVLPLIPSYVTFITGLGIEDVRRSRRIALVHSLLFVTGFTLVFLALGATATAFGRLLGYHRVWVGRIGGVLVVLLGLYLIGAFNFGPFTRERRVHFATKPLGYFGTLVVGMGLLMLKDMMALMSQWLQPMTPEFLLSGNWKVTFRFEDSEVCDRRARGRG